MMAATVQRLRFGDHGCQTMVEHMVYHSGHSPSSFSLSLLTPLSPSLRPPPPPVLPPSPMIGSLQEVLIWVSRVLTASRLNFIHTPQTLHDPLVVSISLNKHRAETHTHTHTQGSVSPHVCTLPSKHFLVLLFLSFFSLYHFLSLLIVILLSPPSFLSVYCIVFYSILLYSTLLYSILF